MCLVIIKRKELRKILGAIESIRQEMKMQKETFDKILAEVKETRGLVSSLIALVQKFSAAVKAVKDDPEEVAKLVEEFDASQAEMVAAIQANPAPNDPPVDPTVP